VNLNNVIVAELDISVPELDFNEIENFCAATRDAYLNSRRSNVDKIYFERNARVYPWNRRVLEYDNEVLYDVWKNPAFKPVKTVIDQLGVDEKFRCVNMIFQDGQPEYDFNFHFDNTHQIGFRICFGLTKTPFLEFSKIKSEFKSHALGLGKLSSDMLHDEIFAFTPSKRNCVLAVNGDSHPHRVPVSEDLRFTKRAVFIVYGNATHLDFPVVQSLEKSL
jgi:hypothetical protein